ncbi:MAG: PspA/IM30 family protein [Candidatus Krumholzibacteria bacterium]
MAWGKVWTAVKGMAAETGEAIAENQALRILDQEIREADEELRKAKTNLTAIIAKRKAEERKVFYIQAKVTEYEGYATQALENSNEQLAIEVAEKIAELETDLATHQGLHDEFSRGEQGLRPSLKKAEVNLKRLKQQLDVVKATASVQKAQAAVSGRFSGTASRMNNALGSLERIKKRQQETADRLAASAEMEAGEVGDDLEAKLREAGITRKTDANQVLARLKAKKN